MLRRVRQIGDMVADQLRAPEGAAGPGPRGADGQGARRPRAVRGDPVGRRGRPASGPASASSSTPTSGPTARVVAVMRGARGRDRRYGVVDPVPGGTDGDRRLHKLARPGREAGAGSVAERPGDHRPLRADAQDLREAGADAARRRRRDPAHGRHQALMAEQDVYALRVRGHALRRRHDDGLAQGLGRAGARAPDIGAEFRRYLATVDLR